MGMTLLMLLIFLRLGSPLFHNSAPCISYLFTALSLAIVKYGYGNWGLIRMMPPKKLYKFTIFEIKTKAEELKDVLKSNEDTEQEGKDSSFDKCFWI